MAEHEPSIGLTSDWYTPPSISSALGLVFDLDPCSPGHGHWVPARKIYTEADDGLWQPWTGRVFMNPPFGGRRGHVPRLRKFLEHANGIAIVRAYTSSDWWHEYVAPGAETLLFSEGQDQVSPARRIYRHRARPWRGADRHGRNLQRSIEAVPARLVRRPDGEPCWKRPALQRTKKPDDGCSLKFSRLRMEARRYG